MIARNKFWLLSVVPLIALMILTLVKSEEFDHGERDAFEILQQLDNINREILQLDNVEETTKLEALNLVNKLTKQLKLLGKVHLKQLSSGNSTVTSLEQDLMEEIYLFNEELFEEIYKGTINDISRGDQQIELRDLIKYTRNIKSIEQALHGFITIFNEMKNNNQLYNPQIFNLAHHVSDIKNMDNYQDVVSDVKKRNVETMLNELPECLKQIVKGTKLCIKNVGYFEYLYAEGGLKNYYVNDKDRRNVYTWVPGGMVTQGGWVIEPEKDDIYYIKNLYHNEYLYASYHDFNDNLKFVWSWIPGTTDEQFNWEIELLENYCRIKNVLFNGYLTATDILVNEQRRRVFTCANITQSANFLWSIEDCSTHDWIPSNSINDSFFTPINTKLDEL